MPVSIMSNLSSTYAQQAVQKQNQNITLSTQKLTSGLRVFRADQDPAATAVGTGLKVESAALRQAQLNVTSGVSMLQIADGALGQIGDLLNRMKTLATQASSGNIGDAERAVINLEFQALKQEVDRTANDTEFNGVSMLAGDANFTLQGGSSFAADGITKMQFNGTTVTTDASYRYSYDALTEQFTLSRVDDGLASSQTVDLTNLLDAVAGPGNQLGAGQDLELNFSGLGVSLNLGPSFDRTADILPTVTDNTVDVTFADVAYAPALTGVDFGTAASLQGLGAAYNHMSGQLTANVMTDGSSVTLGGVAGLRYAVDGGAMSADGAASAELVGATTVDIYIDDGVGGYTLLGQLQTSSISTSGTTGGTIDIPIGQGLIDAERDDVPGDVQLTYKVGSGLIQGQDLIDVRIPSVTVNALGLTTLDVLSTANADVALDTLEQAMTVLNQARATVGAQQSRLEMVGSSLSVTLENNTLAESALMDVDVSEEITNLANSQAMLQVGVSMLSQANSLPDMLLQMLKNG